MKDKSLYLLIEELEVENKRLSVFIDKVAKTFSKEPPTHKWLTPGYQAGYVDCFKDLKRAIYEKK